MYKYINTLILLVLMQGCTTQPTKEEIIRLSNKPCHSVIECMSTLKFIIKYNLLISHEMQAYKAIVLIELNVDNSIKSIRVTESNGSEEIDNRAIAAVKKSAPFTFLEGLNESQREIFNDIAFNFKASE